MKPNEKWIDDWQIGLNSDRERNVSCTLVNLFADFWKTQGLDEKSKTTRNRYSGGLHSLDGYLVELAILDDGL